MVQFHSIDPAPRQPVMVSHVTERNDFIAQENVAGRSHSVCHEHLSSNALFVIPNSKTVQTVVSFRPPAIQHRQVHRHSIPPSCPLVLQGFERTRIR